MVAHIELWKRDVTTPLLKTACKDLFTLPVSIYTHEN